MADVLGVLAAVLAGLVLFWLFGLKAILYLFKGRSVPCPACMGPLIQAGVRRRHMQDTLDRAGIQPGEALLEIGPGPGAFTLIAANMVGESGRVIAVDIQPQMIEMLVTKLEAAGVFNVETHVADACALPLPDNSVNRAFLVTVLPEIPDKVAALREIRRVLAPGGVLSITEEFTDPDYPRRRTTLRWAEEAGFHERERFGSWWRYTINLN